MWFVFIVSFSIALVVSATCSIAESALLSLSTAQIVEISKKNPKIGAIWEAFKRDMNPPITAILTLNTSAHTIGASFAGASFAEITGNRWVGWFSLVFTFLMLQFTEILPKTLGVRFNRRVAVAIGLPLYWLTKASRPILNFFQAVNAPFERMLKPQKSASLGALQEITLLTSLARSRSQLDAEQERIILATLKLSQTEARDVMVPFDEVSTLTDNMTVRQALEIAQADSHTRFPVCYSANANIVVGYVNIKELVIWRQEGGDRSDLTGDTSLISNFVHKIKTIPPTEKTSEALNYMVKVHEHIALVGDADQTLGILTLEDLVEELVGEIEDEFDKLPETLLERGKERRKYALVGGGARLKDAANLAKTLFPKESSALVAEASGQNGEQRFTTWLESRLGGEVARNARVECGELLVTVRRARRGQVFDASIAPTRRSNDASRNRRSVNVTVFSSAPSDFDDAFEINADDLECDPCARFDDLTARRPFSEEQLDALRVPGTSEDAAPESAATPPGDESSEDASNGGAQ